MIYIPFTNSFVYIGENVKIINNKRTYKYEKFKQLTDEELNKVTGGVEWKGFGQYVIDNGGKRIPKLIPLVEAIIDKDYSNVAMLALDSNIANIPIVKSCLANN